MRRSRSGSISGFAGMTRGAAGARPPATTRWSRSPGRTSRARRPLARATLPDKPYVGLEDLDQRGRVRVFGWRAVGTLARVAFGEQGGWDPTFDDKAERSRR